MAIRYTLVEDCNIGGRSSYDNQYAVNCVMCIADPHLHGL